MIIVVVDDERTFTDESFKDAIYLRTEDEAILWLAKWWNENLSVPFGSEKWIDQIWFDHDLGEGNGSGHAVAKFFARICQSYTYLCQGSAPVEDVYVHSQNPVGAERICSELGNRIFPNHTVKRVGLPDVTVI